MKSLLVASLALTALSASASLATQRGQFTCVPDGSSTLLLLGLAGVALGLVRKFSK